MYCFSCDTKNQVGKHKVKEVAIWQRHICYTSGSIFYDTKCVDGAVFYFKYGCIVQRLRMGGSNPLDVGSNPTAPAHIGVWLNGTAAVSKTVIWEFESLHACSQDEERVLQFCRKEHETMSKRRYTNNWISPTHGELEISQIPKYIREYYERMKDFGQGIHITIGTDSQNFDYTKEVNVIAVICEGHGGIFFYKINARDRISDVRTKLRVETGDSLDIAEQLIAILEEKEYEEVFLNTSFTIHIDAGYSDKGKTKELIPELVGWVKAMGYEAKVKPDSYVASGVADKISK